MITPEQKDGLLIKLASSPNRAYVSIDKSHFSTDIDEHTFLSIIEQFEERNFIKKIFGNELNSEVTVSVGIRTDDFLLRGGHRFEEEIFRNNFTKLELELSRLEKQNPAINFDNATKLVSAVASGFDIYKDLSSL